MFFGYGCLLAVLLFAITSVYPLVRSEGTLVPDHCPKLNYRDPSFFDTFYREHVFKDIPCVIEGGVIDDWKALTAWDWPYLTEKIGADTSVIINHANKSWPLFGPTFSKSLRTNFSDFVRRVTDPNEMDVYYFNQQYNESGGGSVENFLVKHLQADYSVPDFITRFYFPYQTNLWLGKGPLRSAPHFDGSENLLVQIKGSKIFRVYPPTQSKMIYPNPPGSGKPPHFTSLDVDAPDMEKYPNFKYAHSVICEAKAGNILFLPPRWWHAVNSTGDQNFAINYWFSPKLGYGTLGRWVTAARYVLDI